MAEIAILGCGPAGLIAAHAVRQSGHKPVILSSKQKSRIPGSQYLHQAIPDLTAVYPENTVQYVRMGTAEGYAYKVYGDSNRYTGWDNYRTLYPSWNVIKAYDTLWDEYEAEIIHWKVHNEDDIRQMKLMWDVVISTIPQQALCQNKQHVFAGVPYWIKPLPVPEIDKGHDIVIYNGMPADHWYRYSVLGDRCSIETTSMHYATQTDGWINGMKATHNTCDCYAKQIHRVGRWAEWRHGVLLHHVYHKVREIANAIGS